MNLTTRQLQILDVVVTRNPDGSCVDMDQLLTRLADQHGWETSKQSLQFSIRALIKHGLVEKLGRDLRRQRSRLVIGPTELAELVMNR